MKFGDIEKLHEAGLITSEQRQAIIKHFELTEGGGNKFLAIVSMIGAVLIVGGLILLVAAHWNGIPRGVKIAGGLALMLGLHAGGWWLREIQGQYRKSGEALHVVGSGLFLANIALVGQVYNLSSRPPNAFLLWWAGIAALPWLLRSKAQHVLALVAFGIWFGMEVNERGWLYCGNDVRQLLLYSLLGLVYLGAGWVLRRGSFADFAGVTEKLGLLLFLLFSYPTTWKICFGSFSPETQGWVLPALGLAAIAWLTAGMVNLRGVAPRWRWTLWGVLVVMVAFMASVWFGCWQPGGGSHHFSEGSWCYAPGTVLFFAFYLVLIQVGLHEGSTFLVNTGVTFIALDIVAAYLDLFGSLARTGLMFLVSGVLLIVFGIILEKKRRTLMKRIHLAGAEGAQ